MILAISYITTMHFPMILDPFQAWNNRIIYKKCSLHVKGPVKTSECFVPFDDIFLDIFSILHVKFVYVYVVFQT